MILELCHIIYLKLGICHSPSWFTRGYIIRFQASASIFKVGCWSAALGATSKLILLTVFSKMSNGFLSTKFWHQNIKNTWTCLILDPQQFVSVAKKSPGSKISTRESSENEVWNTMAQFWYRLIYIRTLVKFFPWRKSAKKSFPSNQPQPPFRGNTIGGYNPPLQKKGWLIRESSQTKSSDLSGFGLSKVRVAYHWWHDYTPNIDEDSIGLEFFGSTFQSNDTYVRWNKKKHFRKQEKVSEMEGSVGFCLELWTENFQQHRTMNFPWVWSRWFCQASVSDRWVPCFRPFTVPHRIAVEWLEWLAFERLTVFLGRKLAR